MKKGDARRQQLLERLADQVLAGGLQEASLRPLAAAVGTSDRMLLHYFVTKEELLTATLTLVTERMIRLLDSAQPAPMPFASLLPHLALLLKDAKVQPYLQLWLELVTFAMRNKEPFRAIAQQISQTLLQWIATALHVEREEERQPLAALTLAIIEGFVLFDALGIDRQKADALAGVTQWFPHSEATN
jgi:AcrR family transcriptional regulator